MGLGYSADVKRWWSSPSRIDLHLMFTAPTFLPVVLFVLRCMFARCSPIMKPDVNPTSRLHPKSAQGHTSRTDPSRRNKSVFSFVLSIRDIEIVYAEGRRLFENKLAYIRCLLQPVMSCSPCTFSLCSVLREFMFPSGELVEDLRNGGKGKVVLSINLCVEPCFFVCLDRSQKVRFLPERSWIIYQQWIRTPVFVASGQ